MKHTIQVCGHCNFTKTEEEAKGERGGVALFKRLADKLAKSPLAESFAVEQTRCMGGCSHACVVAFQAPGKIGWLFGDLNPRFSVPSILEFAAKYLAAPDGRVPYDERPPELAAGLIGRLYPPGDDAAPVEGC